MKPHVICALAGFGTAGGIVFTIAVHLLIGVIAPRWHRSGQYVFIFFVLVPAGVAIGVIGAVFALPEAGLREWREILIGSVVSVLLSFSLLYLGVLIAVRMFDRNMERVSPEKGRSILIAYVTVILLLSAMNMLPSVLLGFADVLEALVLPALAIVLFFWLFQGSKGAKWVTVVGCLLLGGIFGVLTIAFLLNGAFVQMLLPAGMAAVSLSFAVVLVASKSVNAFLESRRQKTNVP